LAERIENGAGPILPNLEGNAISRGGNMLSQTVIQELKTKLKGELIEQGEAKYESARVYNGMIDERA
jgi:hypothetical protein